MLRVTIELVPLGIESRTRVIATGTIANTGTGTRTCGDYRVELRDAAGRKWKSGHIEGFPRTRLLAWDLLYRALRKLVGDRNPNPDSGVHLVIDGGGKSQHQHKEPIHDRPTITRNPQAP